MLQVRRDAVDTEYTYEDQDYVLIDTPVCVRKVKFMNPLKSTRFTRIKSNRTIKCSPRCYRC